MPIKDPKKLQEARKRADAKRRGERALSWCAVVYPESAPENWRDILDNEHIQWIESPLHDKDTNPTGEVKKAHWHVLLQFESVKNLEQVKKVLEPLNCTIPIQCNSAKGMVRYMAHVDNPEKYQYNVSDIVAHGGADVSAYFTPTTTETKAVLKEIIQFVTEKDVVEYQDLVFYAMNNNDAWFDVLSSSSYMIIQFIKSKRHSGRKAINPITGEMCGEEAE